MSENLGLLQTMVSVTPNDVTDNDGISSEFNFEDFENDLDFINQHLEDEENPHQNDSNEAMNSDENGVREMSVGSVTSVDDAVRNSSENEMTDKKSYDLQDASSNKTGKLLKDSRKVSFDLLPDMYEYSDDFESSAEEGEEEEKISVIPHGNETTDCNASTSKVNHKSDLKAEINTCSNCNCRLTQMHILDLTNLGSLFYKRNEKGKGGSVKGKPPNKMKHGKNRLSKCEERVENTEETINALKQSKKPQLDASWTKSSNPSLLQWLKLKNKGERRKRAAEKKAKREEKQAKRREALEKLCRKEKSDKKVLEWMKRKKREKRVSRKHFEGKVAPLIEEHLLTDVPTAPNGYTVVDSFEKKEGDGDQGDLKSEEKGAVKVSNKTKVKHDNHNTHKSAVTIAPAENKKNQSTTESRRSYDEWLKEKKHLFLVNDKKTQSKSTSEDSQLFAKERTRRLESKDDSKRKVDSNWVSKSKKIPTASVSKPGQGVEKQQPYRWRDEPFTVKSHESEKLQDCSNSIAKEFVAEKEKGAVLETKIADCRIENEPAVTNILKDITIQEVT